MRQALPWPLRLLCEYLRCRGRACSALQQFRACMRADTCTCHGTHVMDAAGAYDRTVKWWDIAAHRAERRCGAGVISFACMHHALPGIRRLPACLHVACPARWCAKKGAANERAARTGTSNALLRVRSGARTPRTQRDREACMSQGHCTRTHTW